MCLARLLPTNSETFTLSDGDAGATVTDACCLVSSFAALCASKVGKSDL